jgi:hypothetical protein
MLSFEKLYQRYFNCITWESVDAFETRVATLLPCWFWHASTENHPLNILQRIMREMYAVPAAHYWSFNLRN